MSTIKVPTELLPVLRENVRLEIALSSGSLDEDSETFDADCDRVEGAIAAHKALAGDSDVYPRDAVHLAARASIKDAASRIADDALSVDEAEMYVRQVRACERLVSEALA